MMTPTIESGTKFNNLTVINYRPGEGYLCRCDCGNETVAKAYALKNNKHKSCGCRPRRLKPNHAAAKRNLFKTYKHNAKLRNLEFLLTEEEFSNYLEKNCAYCGRKPLMRLSLKRHEDFRYNGVDRIDSKLGYTVSNCTPCCKICNFAKLNFPVEEFLSWLNDIRDSARVSNAQEKQ